MIEWIRALLEVNVTWSEFYNRQNTDQKVLDNSLLNLNGNIDKGMYLFIRNIADIVVYISGS